MKESMPTWIGSRSWKKTEITSHCILSITSVTITRTHMKYIKYIPQQGRCLTGGMINTPLAGACPLKNSFSPVFGKWPKIRCQQSEVNAPGTTGFIWDVNKCAWNLCASYSMCSLWGTDPSVSIPVRTLKEIIFSTSTSVRLFFIDISETSQVCLN